MVNVFPTLQKKCQSIGKTYPAILDSLTTWTVALFIAMLKPKVVLGGEIVDPLLVSFTTFKYKGEGICLVFTMAYRQALFSPSSKLPEINPVEVACKQNLVPGNYIT